MNILVACEESQAVTIELRKRGHQAYSCDLLECSGGHPEWHIQNDLLEILRGNIVFVTQSGAIIEMGGKWDMIIGFPPCTHLSVSGAKHFVKKREDGRQREAIEFFMKIMEANCDKIAVENPVNIISGKYIAEHFPDLAERYNLPIKSNQIIQPWQFGDQAQKTTCLWLKGLPELLPTEIVDKGAFYVAPSGKKLPAWYGDAVGKDGKKLGYNTDEIKKLRSKTFPGIARAMAEQWTEAI